MPTKSLRQRAKKAKREGVPAALRDADFGVAAAKSRHAAKKSRGIRAVGTMADRKVSRKKAPGEGVTARPQAEFPRPAGEPVRNRARRRMAGTDLPAPKIGSERTTELLS
jgi:hypothetical protein